jgi:hypothetical protein
MQVKTIPNRHGTAETACKRWLAGSLWGNPISLGPGSIHVYGAWRRTWRPVWVQFLNDRIIVVRPNQ